MKNLAFTLIFCIMFLGTSFAQFGLINRGPLSGNCPGPELGLDRVNNTGYICSDSGTGQFQWYALPSSSSGLPSGSIGQTLYNKNGATQYAATSGILFDLNGSLLNLTSTNFNVTQAGLATFNSGIIVPSDGTHAGQIGLTGNTVNPAVNSNIAYIFGPNQATFNGFILFQMPSAALPTGAALCLNNSFVLKTCTSVVASDGTCTCP